MKKIIVILLVMVMMFSLCACGADDNPEGTERIGYVIIPHADGEEHVDITSYFVGSNGVIMVTCVDGRKIVSPLLIAVLEK